MFVITETGLGDLFHSKMTKKEITKLIIWDLYEVLTKYSLVESSLKFFYDFFFLRLVLNITSGEKKSQLTEEIDGNLVIETNFRVYSYDPSALQTSLLAIFCDVEYKWVNSINFTCCWFISLGFKRVDTIKPLAMID